MPTGRITFPGGLSGNAVQVPQLPQDISGVRGSSISYDDGHSIVQPIPSQPVVVPSYGTGQEAYYAAFIPEIAKANFLGPSTQGRRAQAQFRANYTPASANHNPSRSQKSEGYTNALQVFAASNTWQLAGPQDSPGTRAKQPSTKFVSPFASLPIPVKMPWDL